MIACTNCRFHDDGYGNNCSHPSVTKPDPVYGRVLETCHNARGSNGACGVEAKFFAQSRMSRVRNYFCGCPLTQQQCEVQS